jgi:Mn-dependent DtxR family transcriptional regulator
MDADGQLHLTDTGREIAERIYERHCLLTQWLEALGVDDQTAAEDACRIEHDISEMTFQKLKEHIQNHSEANS